MADIPLFERLTNESSAAYAAFCTFRDLGPDRSLAEAGRRLANDSGGSQLIFLDGAQKGHKKGTGNQAPGHIKRWAAKFHWRDRATAWDDYVDARLRAKQFDEIERMAKRQAQESVLAASTVMAPLLSFAKAVQQDPGKYAPEMLATGIMRELLELGQKSAALLPRVHEAERTARGIRLDNKTKTSPQEGKPWLIETHQPERKEAENLEEFLTPTISAEWPGDPGGGTDDDD